MSEHDDDLASWADDDLVRALRAPGSSHELAEEEQYVAAYRAARAGTPRLRSLPRRAAGRLGAGGTAVVVTVALSSGVAAAYTGHLPDPVQWAAHSVLGAPAPDDDSGRPSATKTHSGTVLAPTLSDSTPTAPSSSTPITGPTPGSTPTSDPTSGGSTDASQHHHGTSPTPTSDPTQGPTSTSSPSATPTSDPSSGSTGASAISMAAPTHRVGVGQVVTLSTVVTDATGSALPDQPVALQVRGPRRWRAVATTTTDAAGTATVTSTPVSRSARFRWHTAPRLHSTAWRIRMVPTLTATAQVGGTDTVVSAATQGTRPGDRVLLLRRLDHRLVLVSTTQLDASGAAAFQLATPPRRAVYAVRLLPTRLHAATRARVPVQPLPAASVSVIAPTHRVPVGGSVGLSGVVRAADGDALPGRRVALQIRGPARWRSVGTATTDASGAVTIATPVARATARYRLRAPNGVHSLVWRVVMVPVVTATTRPDGTAAAIDATTSGGRPGDRVVLFRRQGGRLVRVQHGVLDAGGAITFTVSPRAKNTAFVVRLLATRRHGWAIDRVVVPGTG